MITDMRQLEDQYKQSFRSLPEVYSFLGDLRARVVTKPAIRLATGPDEDKRPTMAALLNAMILAVQGMPREAQVEMIEVGMERLNALLRGETLPEKDSKGRVFDWKPREEKKGPRGNAG